jgi:succinate dehydrogenase hydrophobic anchor subunit
MTYPLTTAIAPVASAAAGAAYEITVGGWIMMGVSVVIMTSLLSWCIYKVFATPGSETHLHSQSDIEPPDKD